MKTHCFLMEKPDEPDRPKIDVEISENRPKIDSKFSPEIDQKSTSMCGRFTSALIDPISTTFDQILTQYHVDIWYSFFFDLKWTHNRP